MSKKLPKATAQTFDDIRQHRDTAPKATAKNRPKPAMTSKRRPSAKPAAAAERTPPPSGAEAALELRRAQAGQIVERFTAYSAVGSIIPIPLVDTLSVVLLIVSMVKSLLEI